MRVRAIPMPFTSREFLAGDTFRRHVRLVRYLKPLTPIFGAFWRFRLPGCREFTFISPNVAEAVLKMAAPQEPPAHELDALENAVQPLHANVAQNPLPEPADPDPQQPAAENPQHQVYSLSPFLPLRPFPCCFFYMLLGCVSFPLPTFPSHTVLVPFLLYLALLSCTSCFSLFAFLASFLLTPYMPRHFAFVHSRFLPWLQFFLGAVCRFLLPAWSLLLATLPVVHLSDISTLGDN